MVWHWTRSGAGHGVGAGHGTTWPPCEAGASGGRPNARRGRGAGYQKYLAIKKNR